MTYLKVKDWDSFQHYKDRNPPWIKLSTDTFQDYEFSRLQDASKLLAICIWTLASRYKDPKEGLVPADLDYIKSQCGLGKSITIEHLKELIEQGFIIDASGMLADCKQSAIPETYRKEGYSKEVEQRQNIGEFDSFWNAYGKIGNKQQALKSYNKAIKEGVNHEAIIAGLEKYQTYCRELRQEQKYIKHASTWLNNRGWEDEYHINATETKQQRKSRESKEAAIRGMLRAENPDF